MYSLDDYHKLAKSLIPRGKFWNREDSSLMSKILKGLSEEFVRSDERAEDLISEANTLTTVELLTEWEEEFGLPEDGLELAPTIEGRRQAVNAKLIQVGEQDPDYYEAIALALGYTVRIEQFAPFWVGISTVGDSVGDLPILFTWYVWVDAQLIEYSIDVNLSLLIQQISKVKPAYTQVFFDFENCEFSRAFGRGFDSCPHYDNYWPDTNMAFDASFSSAFENNHDYYGVNYTGAFSQALSIAFDRHSGGGISYSEFDSAFLRPV